MSIICTSRQGWLISHSHYIATIYKDMPDGSSIHLKEDLFRINVPYVKKKSFRKRKVSVCSKLTPHDHELMSKEEVDYVQNTYNDMCLEFRSHLCTDTDVIDNQSAMILSDLIYQETCKCAIDNAEGVNAGYNTVKKINSGHFIFPENSRFFCKDVVELSKHLSDQKFDLILLDPPWWNKYIRRKRKKSPHAYSMMHNNDLKNLDLDSLLSDNGLVAVWCTNSIQHLNMLKNEIFPKWNIKFISKWYWLKITQSGELICSFSTPPGKQPFEQIIFGCRNDRKFINPPNEKVVLSVPSALHSHKPPLVDLLKVYLSDNPKCLELFARYLLPNWTSYGNEVLKFQHESLYTLNRANQGNSAELLHSM